MISGLTRNVSGKAVLLTLTLMFLAQAPAWAETITFTWSDTGSGFLYDNPVDGNTLAQFENATFQITGSGQTDNVVFGVGECLGNNTDNCARLDLDSAQIHISDVKDRSTDFGSVTFVLDPGTSRAFINNDTGEEGFSQVSLFGRDLYFGPTIAPGLLPWFMKSDLGPITDISGILGAWTSIGALPVTGAVVCDDLDSTKRQNCQQALEGGKAGGLSLTDLTLTFPPGCDQVGATPCTNSLGTFDAKVTPEPSSILLLGAGLVGISLFIRRRQTLEQPAPSKLHIES
jgi:hypothetical protein